MGGYRQLPVTPFEPNQQSPLDAYGKVLNLQNLIQQQKLLPGRLQQQQQELQTGALDVQSKQIAIQNQTAGMKAMQQWDGKSYDDLPDLMAKNGADLQTVMNAKTGILKYKQDLATLGKDQLANQKAKNDGLLGLLENVKTPQDFEQARQSAIQQGYADPQTASQFSFDHLDMIKKSLLGHEALISDAAKQSETFKNTQEGRKAQLEANNLQNYGPQGPAAEAKYRSILGQLSKGQNVSDDDLTFAKGFEASGAKTTTQSDTLGITSSNTSKPSGLAAVSRAKIGSGPAPAAGVGTAQPSAPSAKDSIVDMVGQYKLNPTVLQRMIVKHPDVIAAVNQKYPDWDQPSYNAKNKILMSYTSGPESKSINAINTALGHAGELGEAIDALDNSQYGVKMLRDLGNRLGVQVGADKVTTFNTIVHRLAPEISAAYVQGGGTGKERGSDAADFDASLGSQQLRNNLAETVKLLRSKIGAQENQWNTTFQPKKPEDQFGNRFITPAAKQTLDKWSAQAPTNQGKFQVGQTVSIHGKQMKVTAVHPDGSFDAQ